MDPCSYRYSASCRRSASEAPAGRRTVLSYVTALSNIKLPAAVFFQEGWLTVPLTTCFQLLLSRSLSSGCPLVGSPRPPLNRMELSGTLQLGPIMPDQKTVKRLADKNDDTFFSFVRLMKFITI